MRCEAVRRALSGELDGEPLGVAAVKHLAACSTCPAYRARLLDLRTRTSRMADGPAPDLVDRVLGGLHDKDMSHRRRTRWLAPAAGLAAGALIGVVLAGGLSGPTVSLAGRLPEEVVASQASLNELEAAFTVRESIRPGIQRTYDGALSFESPEYLALNLVQTGGPAGWSDNSWSLIVDGTSSLVTVPFPCPTLGGCTEARAQSALTTGRDPFSSITPAPLDAVIPTAVLRNSDDPVRLPARLLAGRDAVGFEVTAAQARPLLDAFFGMGNWRQIHSTDLVSIWLDIEQFTPLLVTVTASVSPDRAAWAARRDYEDGPEPYLVIEYQSVTFGGITRPEITPPVGVVERDAGFVGAAIEPPIDPGLPLVVSGHIAGFVQLEVWAWSDGRAWLRLDRAVEWTGPGLFGNTGLAVEAVQAGNGIVYRAGDGSAAFVHGDGFDAIVSGSVDTDQLVEAIGLIPGRGIEVPSDWPESLAAPNVMGTAFIPVGLPGFGDPIVGTLDGTLVIDLFGGGDRSARITQRPGERISPPLDPDARAVEVRGTTARYSPMFGTLEWVEDGVVFSVEAPALSSDEVVTIAESLVSPEDR
jgi:hypothetical protein